MKLFRPLLRTSMVALAACLMMGTISLAQQSSSTDDDPPAQQDNQSSKDQKDKKDQKDSDNVTPDRDKTSPPAERTQRDARQRQEQTREQQEEARERQEKQARERQEQGRDRQNEQRTDDREQERDRRRDDRSDRRNDQRDRRDDRFDRQQDRFDRRTDGRRQDQRDEREDRSGRRDARSEGQQDQGEVELGASLRANDQDQLVVSNLSRSGLLVDSGIRQGDVIVSVDNRNVSSEAELRRWLRQTDRGGRLPLVVMRGGQRRTIYVEPGSRLGRGFGRGVDIGVTFRSDPRGRLIVSDLARSGLLVDSGLRPGDVIVQVDDRPIASQVEFTRVLHSYHGPRLPVVVLRDGRRETIYVTIEEDRYGSYHPDDYRRYDSYEDEQAWLGVYLDSRYTDHAVVEAVQVGSPADQVGLQADDWIVRVNGVRIQGPWHLSRMVRTMQPDEEIQLEVSRRMVRDFSTRLAERPARRGRLRYDDEDDLQQRAYRGEIRVESDRDIIDVEQ